MAISTPSENEGGNDHIDSFGSHRSGGSTAGITVDRAAIRGLTEGFRGLGAEIKTVAGYAKDLFINLSKIGTSGGKFSGMFGGGGSGRTSMPLAGTVASGSGGGSGGGSRTSMPTAGGGGGGSFSGLLAAQQNLQRATMQPLADLNAYANQRIGQGADYSLQADRMSVQLQQMYGMSNASVRNQLRMPLTSHYLLGGGNAINEMLNLQATTGLTASKQASTVEAIRAVSGFSYGAGDVTRMLSTMATPDTANRMFMMGGTGMYGMGGKERTGMQSIQDIVRRTGLTNPDALKGALQQGSNTRQRLNAMGVPQDMQDMVIQYAMQNAQYQKKTGGTAMYDPSTEKDRRTMGIEGSYAVQHEKTTGERIKREERFYGRQADNFADFERNLRSTTKILAAFEDKLSGIVGLKISYGNHPATKVINYGAQYGMSVMSAQMQVAAQAADLAADAATAVAGVGAGGDPVDGLKMSPVSAKKASVGGGESDKKLPADTERKLAKLDPRLAIPLRKMLEDKPEITIGDTVRSNATQEQSFRQRYRPTNKTKKEKKTDRIWNGVVWEMKPSAEGKLPAMAPPGQSFHEKGLAADLNQNYGEWIRKNASKYGLSTGYTGTGGSDDEPFHVQPSGTGLDNFTSPGSGSSGGGAAAVSGSVSTASVSKLVKNTTPTSTMTSVSTATAVNYQQPYTGNSALLSGDPIDKNTGPMSSGGAPSIVISPNIYLQGGQSMSTDMQRIAQEVGRLLEHEVKLSMMRGS